MPAQGSRAGGPKSTTLGADHMELEIVKGPETQKEALAFPVIWTEDVLWEEGFSPQRTNYILIGTGGGRERNSAKCVR